MGEIQQEIDKHQLRLPLQDAPSRRSDSYSDDRTTIPHGPVIRSIPNGAEPTSGQRAASEYLRWLLLRPGPYREEWEQYAHHVRPGEVNQRAVCQTMALYLYTTGERDEHDLTVARALKDRVSRALGGKGITLETIRWFEETFGFTPQDSQQLRALYRQYVAVAGHAFISYVRENSADAHKLQQALEAAGIPVWRDTAELWPGEDWRLKIRQAITNDALVFLACFSSKSEARKKSYRNEELTLAIDQMRLRRPDEPWLIPIRFDDCDIPDLDIGGGRSLGAIQRLDFFGVHIDEAAARLVTGIRRILGYRQYH